MLKIATFCLMLISSPTLAGQCDYGRDRNPDPPSRDAPDRSSDRTGVCNDKEQGSAICQLLKIKS